VQAPDVFSVAALFPPAASLIVRHPFRTSRCTEMDDASQQIRDRNMSKGDGVWAWVGRRASKLLPVIQAARSEMRNPTISFSGSLKIILLVGCCYICAFQAHGPLLRINWRP
jgi:hypothetical protein